MDTIHVVGVGSLGLNIDGFVGLGTDIKDGKGVAAIKQIANPFGGSGENGGVGAAFIVDVATNRAVATVASGAMIHAGWARTFDPAGAVVAGHWLSLSGPFDLATGTAVVYHADPAGKAIGGLVDGATYYVIADDTDPNRIALASSKSNATAGVFIPLNAATATGLSHRLTKVNDDDESDPADLDVSAGIHQFSFVFAESGAQAEGFAIGGAVAVSVTNDTALAVVESGAKLDSAGAIDVSASDDLVGITLTGGVMIGESVGFGVSIGVNVVSRDTEAYIGNAIGQGPGSAGTVVRADGPINITTQADTAFWTASLAAAVTTEEPPSDAPIQRPISTSATRPRRPRNSWVRRANLKRST